MSKLPQTMRGGLICLMALAAVVSLTVQGLAQQSGGLEAVFSLRQGFESQRNPDLDPNTENDTRQISNTDIDYTLSSTTRRAALSMTLGARLRGVVGDLDPGEEEGFEIDRPLLAFRHRYTAPNAEFRSSASIQRFNIGFLERLDLIEDDNGSIGVPDDIEDLEGTGFRTEARLRFAADFGQDRPFGWGVSVENSDLTYDDVDGSDLDDSSRTNTSIYGVFDLTPVLRLRTGLTYELRSSETESAQNTREYNVVLTHRRAENGALRIGAQLAQPEDRDQRFTLFFGGTQEVDDVRSFDFNIGATTGEDGDARFVGLINYRQALSRTLSVNAGLNRQFNDSSDNETVLDTAASLGFSQTLTPLSGIDFGLQYIERENFSTNENTSDMSFSVQYVHDLNRDWALSVGASHTQRDESDSDLATSSRLFLSVGRSWRTRF